MSVQDLIADLVGDEIRHDSPRSPKPESVATQGFSPHSPPPTSPEPGKAGYDELKQMDEDAREYFTERAAIGEYDGGLSREEAEQQAAERVFEYRLTGWSQWGVLLGQPGDGIVEAEQWCRERFGDRVVDVRPYRPKR